MIDCNPCGSTKTCRICLSFGSRLLDRTLPSALDAGPRRGMLKPLPCAMKSSDEHRACCKRKEQTNKQTYQVRSILAIFCTVPWSNHINNSPLLGVKGNAGGRRKEREDATTDTEYRYIQEYCSAHVEHTYCSGGVWGQRQ
jgi:hypothetical protein